MTSQTTAIQLAKSDAAWVPFLTETYPPLDALVKSYLSNREIVILCNENSPFCTHALFAALAERLIEEDSACLEEGYPLRLVQSFRSLGLSLGRVPTVAADDFFSGKWTKGEKALTVVRSKTFGQPCLGWLVKGSSNEDGPDAGTICDLIASSFVSTESGSSASPTERGSTGYFYDRNQPPKWDKPSYLTNSNLVNYKSKIVYNANAPMTCPEVPQSQTELPKFLQPPEVELEPSKKK